MVEIRMMQAQEYPLLADFLYYAIFVPPDTPMPTREIIQTPELQVYIEDFGRPEDVALVATENGRIIGCAWARIMNDYGHVDDATPSIAISIDPEHRGRGIGTALLQALIQQLQADGYAAVSLSVQKENFAIDMYRKAGFRTLIDRDDEAIMVLDLQAL